MNTPNPLIPQGSLQQEQSHGKSKVRIAVFLVITLHSVFFTLLLMQGCGGDDPKTASKSPGTQPDTNEVSKLDTNYYGFGRELPSVATNFPTTAPISTSNAIVQPATPAPAIVPVTPPAAETLAQAKEYTIVKGDYLYKIAKDHGVTVAALNEANPGLEPTRLQPGQKIQVPPPARTAPPAGTGSVEAASAEGALKIHVVKGGENLSMIARQHGTSTRAIKAANNLKTDRILVGKKLKIPAPQKPAATGTSASGVSPSSLATNRMATLPTGTTTPNLR